MPNVLVVTLSGSEVSLQEQAVQDLKSALRGDLLLPQDDGYDVARQVYNGMIDRKPALIVRCAGTADVISAVNFACAHSLLVSIRGGGHNVSGNAVVDRGLMIDLSRMRSVRVDPIGRTARAEGGVTWGEMDHEAQAFGLATTGGIFPTTGIAGLTLGGGIGYLNRKYGLACDNLLSADVVTADGRLLTASGRENPDLYWALKGGGGNFGVVTSFEYQLHRVGPVLAGLVIWPLPAAKEVLRFYSKFSLTTPDELRLDAAFVTSPVGPALAIIVCWCGSVAEGEQVLEPLRRFGQPALDTVAPVPYKVIQGLLESFGYKPGFLQYWKSSFLKNLSDGAVDVLVDYFASCPSPLSAIAIEQLGGVVRRVREQDTAFGHREAEHSFLVFAVWTDPTDAERNINWCRGVYEAMQPFLQEGGYVNYLGEREGDARVRAAYGANYDRLLAVKSKYDPANLFRMNQNIQR